MRQLSLSSFALAAGLVSLMATSGCTLKATLNEITDTTSNITGTTSGRTWWNEDGLLNPEHKALAFATYTRDNLEQDLARGEGEYLASLGTLLGVEEGAQPTFGSGAQARFHQLMSASDEARTRLLRESR